MVIHRTSPLKTGGGNKPPRLPQDGKHKQTTCLYNTYWCRQQDNFFFVIFFVIFFFYSQTLNLTKQTVNTHTMGRCEGSLVCKWMLTLRSQWCYCMLNHYLKSLWTRLAYHSSRMNTRAQAGTIRIVAPKKRLNVYVKCKWKELLCKRSFVIYSWSSSGVFIFFKNVCIYLFIFTS